MIRIYLADLYHDHLPTRQHVPLGIGYIGSYLKQEFSSEVDIKLFKSVEKLLAAINARPPDLIALANYTLGCCRFQRHRVRCMNETGGGSWSDARLRESLK